MKKLLLILLCFLFFSQGCISTKLGRTVNNCNTADCIQMNFGPPTQIQKNGNFGEVWIYGGSTNDDTNIGVKQETNVYINSTGYKDKTATMRIFIDKNNKVYKREIKHSKKYNYFYTTLSFTATAIGAPIAIGLIIGLVQLLN